MALIITNQVGMIVVGLIVGLASGIGVGYIGVIPNPQFHDLELQLEGAKDNASTLLNNVESLEQDLTARQAEIGGLQTRREDLQQDLDSKEALVSELQAERDSMGLEAVNLQGQLDVANSRVQQAEVEQQAIESQLSQIQGQVQEKESQISSLNQQISSLQSQVSSLNNDISTLNVRTSDLQSQISLLESIVNLDLAEMLISDQTVNIPADEGIFWLFSDEIVYAGYLLISYSATSNVFIEVITPSGSFFTAVDTLGNSLVIPVVPGQVYDVTLWNDSSVAGTTVTIEIIYVY